MVGVEEEEERAIIRFSKRTSTKIEPALGGSRGLLSKGASELEKQQLETISHLAWYAADLFENSSGDKCFLEVFVFNILTCLC